MTDYDTSQVIALLEADEPHYQTIADIVQRISLCYTSVSGSTSHLLTGQMLHAISRVLNDYAHKQHIIDNLEESLEDERAAVTTYHNEKRRASELVEELYAANKDRCLDDDEYTSLLDRITHELA